MVLQPYFVNKTRLFSLKSDAKTKPYNALSIFLIKYKLVHFCLIGLLYVQKNTRCEGFIFKRFCCHIKKHKAGYRFETHGLNKADLKVCEMDCCIFSVLERFYCRH